MQHIATGGKGGGATGVSRREALRRLGGGFAACWLAAAGLGWGGRPAAAAAANVPWVARHGLTSAEYQTQFNSMVSQGYRLVDISGYEVGGQARYAAIWEKSAGPGWQARHGLTSAQYQATFNQLVAQGYRPLRVAGYTVGGQDYYAAIFEQSGGVAWEARHRLTGAQYQATFSTLVGQGYRLMSVSGYAIGGQDYYAAVFQKSAGPAWQARHGLTSAQYQTTFNQLAAQGYRVVRVSGYAVAGQARYAAIWEQSPATWQARHDLPGSQYQSVFNNLTGQGYRPVCVSGFGLGGRDTYAAIFENPSLSGSDLDRVEADIRRFMTAYDVPGVSVAIAKDGRLVYAQGFGFADTARREAVTTTHRFRVASVSKPITSAAIFTLIAQGRLQLSDRVFGRGALLGTRYGTLPYGRDIEKITVQHLLEHTAGGWTNDGNDPMFARPDLNQAQLISWVLNNRPLDNVPGSTYAYSNFGYCLLGRIIEQVTGQPYAQYVQQAVLAPAGIANMAIAGNTEADRQANEVHYYGQGGEDPYGMQVARMDAHGGWLASATDLVRFGVRVDGYATKPDILSSALIDTMTMASTANAGYAKGWAVNSAGNWWHTGSLPGTGAILVRTKSGFCWAILVNTRSTDAAFFGKLDDLMWQVVGEFSAWPSHDLF